jgi:ABC-type Na+ efflux pump permease subunit
MEKSAQLDAINALRDWSRWLIGLNTVLGGGCLTILQTGNMAGMPRLFMILAIIAFLVSVLSAILLGRTLASLVEHIPTVASIYQFRDDMGLSVRQLARLQLVIFLLACGFMGIWLALKIT